MYECLGLFLELLISYFSFKVDFYLSNEAWYLIVFAVARQHIFIW